MTTKEIYITPEKPKLIISLAQPGPRLCENTPPLPYRTDPQQQGGTEGCSPPRPARVVLIVTHNPDSPAYARKVSRLWLCQQCADLVAQVYMDQGASVDQFPLGGV